MRRKLLIITGAALAPLLAGPSLAQGEPRGAGALETDPLSTAIGARTLTLQWNPEESGGVALSAVAFSGEFPDFAQRLLRLRNDSGVDWRIGPSFGVGVDYFVASRAEGLFLGVVALEFHNVIERRGDRSRFFSINFIPRVGYRWFLDADSSIYVAPFGGPRFEFKLAGDNSVDGVVFEPTRVAPFATVHVGIHL